MVETGRGKQVPAVSQGKANRQKLYRRRPRATAAVCREIRAHRGCLLDSLWIVGTDGWLMQFPSAFVLRITLLHVARASLQNVDHLYRSS